MRDPFLSDLVSNLIETASVNDEPDLPMNFLKLGNLKKGIISTASHNRRVTN